MKYRRLSREELELFREEFVKFLAANGVDADQWVKMKEDEKQKADELIDIFSDFVFETVLPKITFLEKHFANEIVAYQCLKDKVVMLTLSYSGDTIQNLNELTSRQDLKVSHGKKNYGNTRQEFIFNSINDGFLISDGLLYKRIALLL